MRTVRSETITGYSRYTLFMHFFTFSVHVSYLSFVLIHRENCLPLLQIKVKIITTNTGSISKKKKHPMIGTIPTKK